MKHTRVGRGIVLGILLGACLLLASSAGEAKEEGTSYALIMKAKDNPYNERTAEGFREVIEEAGCSCIIEYPEDSSAEEQIAAVRRAMGEKVSAVAVAANDEKALGSVLQDAMRQGVHVLTLDSDTAPGDREVFVNQASAKDVGRALMEAVLDISGGAGQWAILSTTSQASNQNAWIDEMKTLMQEPEYRRLRLVNIVYGMDEYEESATRTRELLEQYPRLKVICAPTVVGMAAAAQVLAERDVEERVLLTGLGMPDEMEPYVGDVCPYFYLWNPRALGEMTAHVSMDLVEGKITGTAGETSQAQGFGTYAITQNGEEGTQVVVGSPIRFDAGNVKAWSGMFSAPEE